MRTSSARGGANLDSVHNPDRFMSDLRQILSQGRKRIGVLVGAGAPLALRVNASGQLSSSGNPLIPGVDALTTSVLDGLNGEEAVAAKAIQVALGSAANIETILSRITLMETALNAVVVNGLNGAAYRSLCQAH